MKDRPPYNDFEGYSIDMQFRTKRGFARFFNIIRGHHFRDWERGSDRLLGGIFQG